MNKQPLIWPLLAVIVLWTVCLSVAGVWTTQERDTSNPYPHTWQAANYLTVTETPGVCIYIYNWSSTSAPMFVIPRTQLPKGKGC